MLNHWMQAMAGGDFRASVGTKGPVGLVAEPADYPKCVAAAKTFVPRSFTGRLKLSDGQIEQKCHKLYVSIRAQALSFLLSVEWTVMEGKELGVNLSEADLHKEFTRHRREMYPTEADLQKYLSERHLVLSDVLYQLKRNVLEARIMPKVQAKIEREGGNEATYIRRALQRYKALIAKTSCTAGYVVPGCSEYRGPPTVQPSPNVILESLASGRAS